jgi:hypothetical protein
LNGDADSEEHTVKPALRLAAINTGEKHQFRSDFKDVVATPYGVTSSSLTAHWRIHGNLSSIG